VSTLNPISVIIPAYQAEGFLAAAVASCWKQTRPPREVIVVDDGSADGTRAAAVALGDRIRFVRVENGGVARARNIGARMATGDIFVFLDADDVLYPHALETLAGALEDGAAGMAYGMVVERAEPPKHARLNGFAFAAGEPPLPARRNFWRSAVITPGSAAVRADLHRRVGGFVSGYEPLEDRDYWVKCGMLAPVVFCDSVVLDKTWRPSSHGSQHAKRIFRGQRAQRDLRGWCAGLGLDASWIPDDREILRRALDEAVWRRERALIRPLRALAAAAGLRHWRSALYALAAPAGAPPDWAGVEPRAVHEA